VVGEEHGGGVGVAESVVGGRTVRGVDVVFHLTETETRENDVTVSHGNNAYVGVIMVALGFRT